MAGDRRRADIHAPPTPPVSPSEGRARSEVPTLPESLTSDSGGRLRRVSLNLRRQIGGGFLVSNQYLRLSVTIQPHFTYNLCVCH